jgi:RNA polymerase sigma-70 factor (ECF subfamily)
VASETVANMDFPEFYARERTPLVRFVMWLGADADLAADVAQTAFERAFPLWATIQHPRAWLRRVSRNELIRLSRTAARETLTDAPPDRSAAISAALAVELRAETRDVLAALAALPPKQRLVMAWAYDGFSDGEIALELGDSPAAVRQNHSKARKKLRRALRSIGRDVQ